MTKFITLRVLKPILLIKIDQTQQNQIFLCDRTSNNFNLGIVSVALFNIYGMLETFKASVKLRTFSKILR